MRGFTLIELLVVIGVLGILAAGLLAAIDPLEQLRKGRDTQKRNIAVELNNALIRYNAINGDYPWGSGTTSLTVGSATANIVLTLIDVGELKPTFSKALPGGTASSLQIIGAATGEVFICFDPESKSISADPSTIFANTNNPPTTTTSGCTATGTCYWCAR